ncbi:MAG: PAS domain S-box protein [Nitrospira sp.]|nr:PAS domain S-box protein [bacterium]MBL7048284.1 PAS domain S-box protein [Nitrospira sp.]
MKKANTEDSSIRNNIMLLFFLIIAIGGIIISQLFRSISETVLLQQGLDRTVLENIINQFILLSTGLTIVSTFLFLLSAILLSRMFLGPIRNLMDGVMDFANGNLDSRVEIESRDELGKLAEGFNFMAEKIRESVSQMRNAKEFTDDIVTTVPSTLIIVDPDLEILLTNATPQKIAPDISLRRLVAQVEEDIVECLNSGDDIEKEISISSDLDEVKQIYQVTISQIHVPDRERTCALLAATDITQRRLSEEAVRLSEDKFSKAFRSSPAFVTISTLNSGVFLDVNDAFLKASGYCREEIIGKSSSELQTWLTLSDREIIVKQLNEHERISNFETRLRTKSGDIINVLYSAELIVIAGEQYIIAVTSNITARKKLEVQLLHAQKMEAVGQLAGGVAHEFNNILTAINTTAFLIKKGTPDDTLVMDRINNILSLTENAAKIARELLAFGRKQHTELVRLDLHETITRIETLLTDYIGESIELQIQLEGKSPVIFGDKAQIEQAIMNLVKNACDAMPEGGALIIKISTTEIDEEFIDLYGFGTAGKYMLLTVSDSGTGMSEEIKNKIFEPFFTTKPVGQGTGLGLSILYGMVKSHSGYINVSSVPGSGTTFDLYFPLT